MAYDAQSAVARWGAYGESVMARWLERERGQWVIPLHKIREAGAPSIYQVANRITLPDFEVRTRLKGTCFIECKSKSQLVSYQKEHDVSRKWRCGINRSQWHQYRRFQNLYKEVPIFLGFLVGLQTANGHLYFQTIEVLSRPEWLIEGDYQGGNDRQTSMVYWPVDCCPFFEFTIDLSVYGIDQPAVVLPRCEYAWQQTGLDGQTPRQRDLTKIALQRAQMKLFKE